MVIYCTRIICGFNDGKKCISSAGCVNPARKPEPSKASKKGKRQLQATEICRVFASVFPGRCLICSYHEYGKLNGLTRDSVPKTHECIEK